MITKKTIKTTKEYFEESIEKHANILQSELVLEKKYKDILDFEVSKCVYALEYIQNIKTDEDRKSFYIDCKELIQEADLDNYKLYRYYNLNDEDKLKYIDALLQIINKEIVYTLYELHLCETGNLYDDIDYVLIKNSLDRYTSAINSIENIQSIKDADRFIDEYQEFQTYCLYKLTDEEE